MDAFTNSPHLHSSNPGRPHLPWRSWFLPFAAACLPTVATHAQGTHLKSNGSSSAVYIPGGTVSVPRGQVITDHRSKQATFTDPWNNPHFGGSVVTTADITHSYFGAPNPPSFSVDSSNYTGASGLEQDIRIFGTTYTAARFASSAENAPYSLSASGASPKPNYRPHANASLDLAGINVWNGSTDLEGRGTPSGLTWAIDLSREIEGPTYRFYLGPVPFNISVNAGLAFTLAATEEANSGGNALSRAETLSASVYGSASFSVDYLVFSAGIEARLDFVNPSVSHTVTASPTNGVVASLDACITPVILSLSLFASIGLSAGPWKWKMELSREILNLESASYCEHYVL